MPTGDIEVRIQIGGVNEFRDVARAVRKYAEGDEFYRRVSREIRDTGKPVVDELRDAVMRVNVTSTRDGLGRPKRQTALRARVAAAIRMSVAYKGIRFNVEGARVDEKYGSALAKYLDGELPGYENWRHPIFGHDRWTVQHGSPWFFETINNHAEDFEEACSRAIDEVAQDIAHGN